ncbi:MAG: GHKL domain-containing protein [Verrucomicrobia bacterium]|nr:GHKL domain-containing protein [Verrucomicrobiota bacterium]
MTIGWLAVWLVLLGAVALLAMMLWRRVLLLRREVRNLVTDGPLSNDIPGPRIIREIHQDLREMARRQREFTRQIADEDFSLRAILASMVEGVLIADSHLRIRLTNERLHQMFSLPKPPVDRTVMEVFRNHLLHQVIQQTLDTEEPRSAELQAEIREGDQFQLKHFQVTSVSLRPREHESLTGALVIFHDVSQIRSLEAVRKEFVANVSHELRTPLAIITGYLETLIEGGGDQETNLRFLKTMHKHAQRLNLLIEDLLALSQLESRKISLHFETVDLVESMNRVLERLDSRIRESGASVTINVPKHLPRIEADGFRIEQAIHNLVENALRHCGKSGVKVTVEVRSDGRTAAISVHDDGVGIPLSDQPHIFERFYRVHKDRSRDAGGTGLGLSIVKHTVQAHGGSVSVQSEPGAGATFVMKLPIRQN